MHTLWLFLFLAQSCQISNKASSKFWDRQTSLEMNDVADDANDETNIFNSADLSACVLKASDATALHQTKVISNKSSISVCYY